MAVKVRKLLTNVSFDHSKKLEGKLVGLKIAPKLMVDEEKAAIEEFGREEDDIPEADLAANGGTATNIVSYSDEIDYKCRDKAYSKTIDKKKLRHQTGPFRTYELRFTKLLTTKLMYSQEIRIRDKVSALPDSRRLVLTGEGSAYNNIFKKADGTYCGNPAKTIAHAKKQCSMTPSDMIIPESVYDVWKYHPALLSLLGESNKIKKLNLEALQEIFEMDRIHIARGKAKKRKRYKSSLSAGEIWDKKIILAYADEEEDFPTAMRTFTYKIPAAGDKEWLVRSWDRNEGGREGSRKVQVAHCVDERIIYDDMIFFITW